MRHISLAVSGAVSIVCGVCQSGGQVQRLRYSSSTQRVWPEQTTSAYVGMYSIIILMYQGVV